LEGLCAVFLVVFALSVRVEWALPAFGGQEQREAWTLRTVSLLDVVLSRQGIAKGLLKASFPMLAYMEGARQDLPWPGALSEVMSYFLGFTARYPRDLAFAGLSGFLAANESLSEEASSQELEKDWGVTPVLYSLPPGEDIIPATVTLGSGPVVAIYHTHASESFLPEIGKKAAAEAFSEDPAVSVVRVGEMLARELQERYRIPCLHSETMHDSDTRIGAYYRSEGTVKAILQKYPDCRVLVDVHRDSQPRSITAVTVRGKPYARLMIVIGTDNPKWVQNHQFALAIVSKLEEGYPGVSRGIFYESAVYNQKYSPMAILVECGGVGNSLAECRNSVQALAWAIASAVLPAAPARP
jgi:stage II sporulation protein P